MKYSYIFVSVKSGNNGKTDCPHHINIAADRGSCNRPPVYEAYKVPALMDTSFIIVCIYGGQEANPAL
jgi:hypothetical protein